MAKINIGRLQCRPWDYGMLRDYSKYTTIECIWWAWFGIFIRTATATLYDAMLYRSASSFWPPPHRCCSTWSLSDVTISCELPDDEINKKIKGKNNEEREDEEQRVSKTIHSQMKICMAIHTNGWWSYRAFDWAGKRGKVPGFLAFSFLCCSFVFVVFVSRNANICHSVIEKEWKTGSNYGFCACCCPSTSVWQAASAQFGCPSFLVLFVVVTWLWLRWKFEYQINLWLSNVAYFSSMRIFPDGHESSTSQLPF